ncbi:MAG: phosphotransferase [Holophagales bacterium]|nr:phosphotransferase [Holophagales bacterium]MYJ25493.1 phosphotransferase [Holophagales bacterium]
MAARALSQTGAPSDSPASSPRDQDLWRPVVEGLQAAGFRPVSFEPLAGDVSARRYARLRLEGGEVFVVCAYPDDLADVASRFLAATELLNSVGVPLPGVERHSLGEPVWILLEDLGPRTIFDQWQGGGLGPAALDRCLTEAVALIGRIQLLSPGSVHALGSPPLDRDLLMTELDLTWERFLEPRGLVRDATLAGQVRAVCDVVCERLGSAAPVPCHRDFMVRNLMPRAPDREGTEPGIVVIDHQDLRLGPPHYDLASLLNDSLTLSAAQRRGYLEVLREDVEELALYNAAVAQRMLKIAGTFAHFAALGNDRHLPLIRPALRRFFDALDALPEGRELAPRLRREWAALAGEAPGQPA